MIVFLFIFLRLKEFLDAIIGVNYVGVGCWIIMGWSSAAKRGAVAFLLRPPGKISPVGQSMRGGNPSDWLLFLKKTKPKTFNAWKKKLPVSTNHEDCRVGTGSVSPTASSHRSIHWVQRPGWLTICWTSDRPMRSDPSWIHLSQDRMAQVSSGQI